MSDNSTEIQDNGETAEQVGEETQNASENASEQKGAEEKAGDGESGVTFDYDQAIGTIEDDKKRDYLSRFKDLNDLAEQSLKLRQELSQRVKKPGEDADEKEIAEYRKAIGAGQTAEEYDVDFGEEAEVTENDTHVVEATKALALKHGIPIAAYKDMAQELKKISDDNKAQLIKDVKEYTEGMKKEYAKEYGKQWEGSLNNGIRVAENLGGDEFKQLMNTPVEIDGVPVQLGSHPAIVKTFINLGKRSGEDGVIGFKSPDEIKSIKSKIKEFREKYPAGSQEYKANYAELKALYEKLEG